MNLSYTPLEETTSTANRFTFGDVESQNNIFLEAIMKKWYSIKPDSKRARQIALIIFSINCLIVAIIIIDYLSMLTTGGVTLVFGDSLVIGSPRRWTPITLVQKLQWDTKYSKIIYAAGCGGCRIKGLLDDLEFNMNWYQPNRVIMFWDSDADQEFAAFTPLDIENIIQAYKTKIFEAARRIMKNGVKLALAGPVVLPPADDGHDVDYILDLFRDAKRNVTVELGIPYIDVREAFKEDKSGLKLTIDGEHLNYFGISITSRLFAELLYSPWGNKL